MVTIQAFNSLHVKNLTSKLGLVAGAGDEGSVTEERQTVAKA